MRRAATYVLLLLGVCAIAFAKPPSNESRLPGAPASYRVEKITPPEPAQLDARWGPDANGYVAKDSDEPGGPVYSWDNNYSTTGYADDTYWSYSFGWNFRYRGASYSSIYICSNGYIVLGTPNYYYYVWNAFPYASDDNGVVGAWCNDLYSNASYPIRWGTYGSAGSRTVVVTFDGCPLYSGGGSYRFQMLLKEADSSIVFQYNTASGSWNQGVAGIENSTGTVGINIPMSYLKNSYAIKFYQPPPLAYDVTVSQILWPMAVEAPVDNYPVCVVKNLGSTAQQNFTVGARWTDSASGTQVYNQSKTCTKNLAQNDTSKIAFDTAFAPLDGRVYNVKYWTYTASDSDHTNDTARTKTRGSWQYELYKDNGTIYWYHPYGTGYMFATKLTPLAYPVQVTGGRIYFYYYSGYQYRFRIWDDDGTGGIPGTLLLDSVISTNTTGWNSITIQRNITVTSGSFYVGFQQTVGPYPATGSDNAAGATGNVYGYSGTWWDFNYYGNLMMRATVRYLFHDVATDVILAPVGSIEEGSFTPQAKVKNRGSVLETSVPVTFKIGSGYTSTATVASLPFNDSATVTFGNWTATGGSYATSCSTALTTDQRTSNDKRTGTVLVNHHDVGAVAIVAPTGSISPGPVTPQASVHNYGNLREACKVFYSINSSPAYLDSALLPAGLPIGADTTLSFASWTATTGIYQARCSTYVPLDASAANDTCSGGFLVGNVDIAVLGIVAPTGALDTGAIVVPSVRIKNQGDFAASFDAWFAISDGYVDSLIYWIWRGVTNLPKDSTVTLVFDTLPKPHVMGIYTTRCSTYAAGDGTPANNALGGTFNFITGPPPPPWQAKKPMPDAPSGKQMKDGAWLSVDNAGDIIGILLALKGNKVGDFYSYTPDGDTWHARAAMPSGVEAKPPYKGSAGASDGNGLTYATKGNNTQGFWRYDAVKDSWKQMANVPLGLSNKKVKGGTDMAYVMKGDTGFVYLLKGYKNEFYRYNTTNDTWQTLPSAPAVPSVKWNNGSWMTYDGTGKLYAHMAKYHTFAAFDVTTGAWVSPVLKGMPFISRTGKSKKSKDGGCGAWLDGAIYALKGGNTQEYYKYVVLRDSWTELETIPAMAPGSLKKKKVKAGADIVAFAPPSDLDPGLYATKGNKCNELWRYNPHSFVLAEPRPDRSGVMTKTVFDLRNSELVITPNPLAGGFVTLRYSLPKAGPVGIRVFDVTGRTVVSKSLVAGRSGATTLDLRSLSAGVYLVKLSSEGFATTRKLVVER